MAVLQTCHYLELVFTFFSVYSYSLHYHFNLTISLDRMRGQSFVSFALAAFTAVAFAAPLEEQNQANTRGLGKIGVVQVGAKYEGVKRRDTVFETRTKAVGGQQTRRDVIGIVAAGTDFVGSKRHDPIIQRDAPKDLPGWYVFPTRTYTLS